MRTKRSAVFKLIVLLLLLLRGIDVRGEVGLKFKVADSSDEWSLPAGAMKRLGDARFQTIGVCEFVSDTEIIDHTHTIFDVFSGRPLRKLDCPECVISMCISRDRKYVGSISSTVVPLFPDVDDWWQVSVCDLSTGKKLWQAKDRHIIRAISFSADGRQIAVARVRSQVAQDNVSEVVIYNSENGAEISICRLPKGTMPDDVALDKRSTLAVAEGSQGISVWDVESKSMRWRSDPVQIPIRKICFTSDASTIVSSGYTDFRDSRPRGEVSVFESDTGANKRSLQTSYEAAAGVIRGRCADELLFEKDRQLVALDLNTMTLSDRLVDLETSGNLLKLSPNREVLLKSDYYGRSVELLSFPSGRLMFRRNGHSRAIKAVAVSHNDPEIVTAGTDRRIRIWNSQRGVELNSWQVEADIEKMGIGRRGKSFTVIIWGTDKCVRELDGMDGRSIWECPFDNNVSVFDISTDGLFFAIGGDGFIEIWNVVDRKRSLRLSKEGFAPAAIELSDSNGQIAVQGLDGSVHVWDIASGEENWNYLPLATDFEVVHIASRNKSLGMLQRGAAFVQRDVVSGKELSQVALSLAAKQEYQQLCWSSDKSKVALLTADVIWTFDVESGRVISEFSGHRGQINQIQFFFNSCDIVSVSDDCTGLIWRCGEAVNKSCKNENMNKR